MIEKYPEERELLDRIKKVIGYVPIGTGDLLRMLTHPDIISYTYEYVMAVNEND